MIKMKKKARRRYFNAREIMERIDKSKAEAQKLIRQSESLDDQAMAIDRWGKPTYVEDAKYMRSQAKKMRKKAQRIYEVRIEELKQKLAVIQTEPLPGMLEDKSVV
jgi:hypothetical protein